MMSVSPLALGIYVHMCMYVLVFGLPLLADLIGKSGGNQSEIIMD